MSMDQVVFEDESWVQRAGRIFRLGFWDHSQEEQRFALDEAEADAAVTAFAPVPLETEHFFTDGRESIFDGKIGTLERVWREGTELFGQVRVPTFVDRVWGDRGRKVSLVFDPVKKQIIRCGLVLRPRVPDAVMMSAEKFSAPDTGEEAALLAAYTEFTHSTTHKENTMADTNPSAPEESRPPAASPESVKFAQALAAQQEENKRLKELMDQANAQMAQFQAERRIERARARVTELVEKDHRLPPAAFNDAVALLARIYADDEGAPVKFAATEGGTQRNRADTLLAVLGALPQIPLMQERIPVHVLRFNEVADPAKPEEDPFTPEGAEASARTWAERRNGRKG